MGACGGGGGGGGSGFGLDSRPANTTCLAPDLSGGAPAVAVTEAFPAAPDFPQITKILQAPGDPSRWFVLQKGGLIRVFDVADPAAAQTWLDFSGKVNAGGEGGLLGMAFHPDFPDTPEVYVSYTGDPGQAMISRISRVLLDDTDAPQNTVEQLLIAINQPYSNHNGGDIGFGDDGDLYIGMGDGGSGGDPENHAQTTSDLLGDMLRINVLGVAWPDPGYAIPADNPFGPNAKCGPAANAEACPEIYAWGLRNPWRWSFDGQTGRLWAGDVGQNSWEEVDIIERGRNYGWRCREGAHDFNTSGCPATGLTDPVAEYDRSEGASVTGGYVYRGTAIPALQGRYVFGDFVSGRIWSLASDGQGGYDRELLVATPYNISTFGLGEDDEIYFGHFSGQIYKLVPGAGADPIPADLADTGCVDASDPTQAADGLIPYGVNAPSWSDGAGQQRWLALPDGETVDVAAGADWELPPQSVIVQWLRLNDRPIETRLLMRHPDGAWRGYSYEWNDAGTAATRVTGGKTKLINGQQWVFPSETQCLQCHTAAAGFSLGLESRQLNRDFTYPSTGRTSNQLLTLEHIDVFSALLPGFPTMPDPADASQPLGDRARAWLHVNCAGCHRPGGPTPSDMDLRYATALTATGTCDVAPQLGDLGIADARLLAPGDASRSVIIARSDRRDADGMPPLGSTVVDAAGVALLGAWADGLSDCP